MFWNILTPQRELDDAHTTLEFLNEKIICVKRNLKSGTIAIDLLSSENKKLRRLELQKKCLKYYYNL